MRKVLTIIIVLIITSTTQLKGINKQAKHFFNLGEQYCEKGDYLTAILEYREALLHEPDYLAAHVNLALAYYQNSFINDMIEELEQGQRELIELKEYAFVLNTLTVISRQRNKVKQNCPPCVQGLKKVLPASVKHLEKAKELDPKLPQPYFNLGIIYHRIKEYDKAMKNFLKVREVYINDKTYLYHMACLFAVQNNESQAIQALKRAIELGFNDKLLLKINSDFDCIREHPKFIAILSQISEKIL